MRRALFAALFVMAFGQVSTAASDYGDEPPVILETFRISMGPQMLAIPGDPAFLIPLNILVTQPTVRINLIFSYDPTILTPVLLAPNIFVQSFVYDTSQPGKIRMSLVTDLSPPPYVPPIMGETTFAWISCRVTSRYIGYDYLTHITYFEDPVTPHPDNFIVLENNNIVAPPLLELLPGDVLVWFPLYGDINDNTYPWEIGDAVTFLNFFMGMTPFTRRQYANSDCNRDGVQASISDLVYLLRVISDDSIGAPPPPPPFGFDDETVGPEGTPAVSALLSSQECRRDLIVDDKIPLGGAAFVIDLSAGSRPSSVVLDPAAAGMQLYRTYDGDLLRITVLDWDGGESSFNGGRLFSLVYPAQPGPIKIVSAEFSDNSGQAVTPSYRFEGASNGQSEGQADAFAPSISLQGYPNPFNGRVSVSFSLPMAGRYDLAVYDLLGRKVKTLFEGQMPQGPGSVAWDAADEFGAGVASGTYLLRLSGDAGQSTSKLFLLK